MAKHEWTSGQVRRFIEHLRIMEMNRTDDIENPETQGYLRALQDIEEKFDT